MLNGYDEYMNNISTIFVMLSKCEQWVIFRIALDYKWYILKKKNLPDFGDGFWWSSMAFSKNRFRSDTDFGTLAGVVGD